jgi:carbamoylphosphate synthase small subunit
MTSQSGDDTQKPTVLAKIFLEDGTVLTGVSFGSHKSAEGEVRTQQ